MRKITWKSVFAMILSVSILMGLSVPIMAEDKFDIGTPQVFVAGDGVYEVENNKENRLSIQVKNKGNAIADNVVVRAKSEEAMPPFKLNFSDGENVGSLGVNGTKTLKLYVNMNGSPDKASYPITLSYTYKDPLGGSYSGSDTIYIKLKGFDREPSYLFDQMKMTPESLSPGTGGTLTGRVKNTGSQIMYQAEVILDKLTTEGISLSGGFSSVQLGTLNIGQEGKFSFPLATSADMAAGNYPVTVKLKYMDEMGKEYEKTQDYYINVGGVSGKASQIIIRNMKEPAGTYGVNQN
ncbi:hypothetical protein, partial [Anaerotignum lactatifermentans]